MRYLTLVLLLTLAAFSTSCSPGEFSAAADACEARCHPYVVARITGWGKGSKLQCTCDTRRIIR